MDVQAVMSASDAKGSTGAKSEQKRAIEVRVESEPVRVCMCVCVCVFVCVCE